MCRLYTILSLLGALSTGLLSSNADQLKTVILKSPKGKVDYTKMGLIITSIVLQVLVYLKVIKRLYQYVKPCYRLWP